MPPAGRADSREARIERQKRQFVMELFSERLRTQAAGVYSFWDFQRGSWERDNGIRIDHLLLSPQAADRLISAGVDKHVRAWGKAVRPCTGPCGFGGGLSRFLALQAPIGGA